MVQEQRQRYGTIHEHAVGSGYLRVFPLSREFRMSMHFLKRVQQGTGYA
jgi:hypothetical protein